MSRHLNWSSPAPKAEELQLPREPGIFRRFWARHPVLTDVLVGFFAVFIPFTVTSEFVATVPATNWGVPTVLLCGALTALAMILGRRKWPIITLGITLVLSLLPIVFGVASNTLALGIACYSIAVYRSQKDAWLALGATVALLVGVASVMQLTGVFPNEDTRAAFSLVFGGDATVAIVGTLIGVNVGNRRRYVNAAIDLSKRLIADRENREQLAASAERARIAREMHDVVSHSLAIVVALSEGAAATKDVDRAREASLAVADTARSALAEMRSMLGVLRTEDSAAPLAPQEPVSPLETVAHAQQAGLPVTLTTIGEPALSPAASHALGRIVQEGVTNAIRHAPKATKITASIRYTPEETEITVLNNGYDGSSGSPDGPGFGLRGIQERVSHLGGTMESASAGNGLWRLHATLPATPVHGDQPASTDPKEASS